MLIPLLAEDGHAGQRRYGRADRLQPAHGAGARGIDIREENALFAQTAQARRDIRAVLPALV